MMVKNSTLYVIIRHGYYLYYLELRYNKDLVITILYLRVENIFINHNVNNHKAQNYEIYSVLTFQYLQISMDGIIIQSKNEKLITPHNTQKCGSNNKKAIQERAIQCHLMGKTIWFI